MRLENKSVVVTGASSGMGKAIVELFVKEGANVLAVARRQERLEGLVDSLKDASGKVVPFVADLSVPGNNSAAIEKAVEVFGRLDILVNNAGIMDNLAPVGEFSEEMLDSVFAINFVAPLHAMRKAIQTFESQGDGGSIINVASLGGIRSTAGVIYCASKAAVISATKNTAHMYASKKIRCNAIAPGTIATEIRSGGTPSMNGYMSLKGILDSAPEKGTAEDIAKAALFLASDDSAYITGDVLIVDGGWSVA